MGTRWDDVKKALQGVRSVEGTKKEISKNQILGMLTVRIFGQLSFQFSFQFSMENESKIKSKIEESMKMNLHGTFS